MNNAFYILVKFPERGAKVYGAKVHGANIFYPHASWHTTSHSLIPNAKVPRSWRTGRVLEADTSKMFRTCNCRLARLLTIDTQLVLFDGIPHWHENAACRFQKWCGNALGAKRRLKTMPTARPISVPVAYWYRWHLVCFFPGSFAVFVLRSFAPRFSVASTEELTEQIHNYLFSQLGFDHDRFQLTICVLWNHCLSGKVTRVLRKRFIKK